MRCEHPTVPARFSRRMIRRVAATFELPWRDVVADARAASAWQAPADELVVWLSERHGWDAELSVLYLAALRGLRDRGDAC